MPSCVFHLQEWYYEKGLFAGLIFSGITVITGGAGTTGKSVCMCACVWITLGW